jgi:hypothetical protein
VPVVVNLLANCSARDVDVAHMVYVYIINNVVFLASVGRCVVKRESNSPEISGFQICQPLNSIYITHIVMAQI